MAAIKIGPQFNVNNRESAVAHGLDPRRSDSIDLQIRKRGHNIRTIIRKIHDENCPQILITAFKCYWPGIVKMTMKEAWLRIIYMEAIAGKPWASFFLAERDEGRIAEAGHSGENKGMILEALDKMMENPV